MEAAVVESLTGLLTLALPAAVQVDCATLPLWDRKLESVEVLQVAQGETRVRASRGDPAIIPSPETHYLISDGQLIETSGGSGSGTLIPLIARSGAVGTLVLGRQR